MRMPDRLQFDVHADDGGARAALPADHAPHAGRERGAPRHRSERGRRTHRRARDAWSMAVAAREVSDTGVGLQRSGEGLGTGLSRCASAWSSSSAATRRCASPRSIPHGVRAEAEFPALRRGMTRTGRRRSSPTTSRCCARRSTRMLGAMHGRELEIVGAGAQRPRGGRAVRGAEARHLLPRRAHAGLVGRGRGAPDRRAARSSCSSRLMISTPCRPSSSGAIDYLVKPRRCRAARRHGGAAEGAARRCGAAASDSPRRCSSSSRHASRRRPGAEPLRWIHASVGQRRCASSPSRTSTSCAPTRSTRWSPGAATAGMRREALIRAPLKDLMEQLDADAIRPGASLRGGEPPRHQPLHARAPTRPAHIHLKGRDDVLPVSRSYLHLFRQM